MEVSKVKLRPETFQLAQRPMSRKRKTKLRRELILEYLNDRPYGKRVKMAELQRVGQFTTPQAADVFIKKMVRDGVIVRHELGLRAYFYTVPGKLVSRKILSAPPPRGSGDPALQLFRTGAVGQRFRLGEPRPQQQPARVHQEVRR